MDDYSNDPSTTGRLSLGGPSHGVIETVDDKDWFAVELDAGTIYRFQIYGSGSLSNSLFGKTLPSQGIEVFDADQQRLDGRDGTTIWGEFGLTFSPETTGTYFVAADGVGDAVGSYLLKMDTIAPETGDTMADALPLTLGNQIVLQDNSIAAEGIDPLVARDEDWLSMDLEAGVTYAVEMNARVYMGFSARSLRGEVSNDAGDVISRTFGSKSFGSETAVFTAPETGTFYFNAITDFSYNPKLLYSVTLREAVEITGTAGNDWLSVPAAEDTVPIAISGGAGQDMISFAARDGHSYLGEGVLVNLENGLLSARAPGYMRFAMDSIEHATGSNFADTLYGRDGGERLRGLGGNDTFFSSEGADTLEGGAALDTLDFRFSDSGVSASLLKGRGWSGDAAGDRYAGIEQVNGSFHDDILWGDHGNNRLDGSHGDDTLIGNGGDDILIGGFGQDVIIYGGNRADYSVTQTGFRTDVTHLNGGAEGHDVILHAEILRFADGDLLL